MKKERENDIMDLHAAWLSPARVDNHPYLEFNFRRRGRRMFGEKIRSCIEMGHFFRHLSVQSPLKPHSVTWSSCCLQLLLLQQFALGPQNYGK